MTYSMRQSSIQVGNKMIGKSHRIFLTGALKRSRNKVPVAAKDIAAGSVITRKDIVAKHPGDWGGLHPWMARQLIGAKAVRDLPRNTLILRKDFCDLPGSDYKFPDLDAAHVADLEKVVGV
jgi:sialic acid synthase SpsE